METTILKLGGALITNKSRPFEVRYDVLKQVAQEIAEAFEKCCPRLVVIHGGGSFGHYVVKEHGTISKSDTIAQTIWFMRELNMIIVDVLMSYGLPATAFDTHALAVVRNGKIQMNTEPLAHALDLGLVPVMYGDIVLGKNDAQIVSGDEVAWYLSKAFTPSRLLFATTIDGVYDGDPSNPASKLIKNVYLSDIQRIGFGEPQGIDVTGGMKLKLALALEYASRDIKEVLIFNGLRKGNVYGALCRKSIRCTRVLLY
uniref:Isopentenyl phosphate kinase n=1 Tax=Ignisphaera aggregans TaxID=334771 RepID=A0A7C2VNV9_9CREN